VVNPWKFKKNVLPTNRYGTYSFMGDSLEPALAPVPAKKSGFDQLRLHNAEYIVNNVPR
jgi:hypothetical protein